jgi:Fe-S-cluster containining protein
MISKNRCTACGACCACFAVIVAGDEFNTLEAEYGILFDLTVPVKRAAM